MLAATITVINNSTATYTIASPSLNYYIITMSGGYPTYPYIDRAVIGLVAIETKPPLDSSTFTNP
jgi:hypothetical protein